MPLDSLKQIAEDTFLLAANIRTGEALDPEEMDTDPAESEARRYWRIVEIVTNLGERLCATAGIPLTEAWVPTDLHDLLDPLPIEN